MFGLGFGEMVIVGIVAILLFGKNLPSVAKSIGGSYREFKKGISEMTSAVDIMGDINSPAPKSRTPRRTYDDYEDREEATAPKFEPPPSEPRSDAA